VHDIVFFDMYFFSMTRIFFSGAALLLTILICRLVGMSLVTLKVFFHLNLVFILGVCAILQFDDEVKQELRSNGAKRCLHIYLHRVQDVQLPHFWSLGPSLGA